MAADKRDDSSKLGRAELSGSTPQPGDAERTRALLDAAFECLPCDVWIRDPSERCVFQNAQSREAWGDIRDQPVQDATVDESTPAVWRENNRRALAGETVSEEVDLVVGDSPRHYYNVIQPIRAGDEILGIMGVNIDLTERLKLETVHRLNPAPPAQESTAEPDEPGAQLRDEIGSRLMAEQRLERSLQALIRGERMAAVGVLASGVAHEFNNALTTMLGQVQLALEHPGRDRERELLERTLRVGRRAARTASKLLEYSSRGAAAPRPCDLNEVVTDAVNEARNVYRAEPIEWRLELRTLPDALADPGRIHQVLSLLIDNAVDALKGRDPRRIEVSTRAAAEGCHVAVTDTGHGVSAKDLSRIFSPFFTTKGERAPRGSAQSALHGTGLGLSVAEALVADHGGELTVESQQGVGSRFSFWVPAAQDEGS